MIKTIRFSNIQYISIKRKGYTKAMIREIKEGSEIIFCRKSSSAYTCKMLNKNVKWHLNA